MDFSWNERLVRLAVVGILAVGALAILNWLTTRHRAGRSDLLLGYPPELFPARTLTEHGALAALTATQARLMALYRQLPGQSEAALWLEAFLLELRQIMDASYQAALLLEVYGNQSALDRVVSEVRQVEEQIAAQLATWLLAADGGMPSAQLSARLAVLRLCADELARLSAESTGHAEGERNDTERLAAGSRRRYG